MAAQLPFAGGGGSLVSGASAADITDTTSTQILAAAGAGIRNYVTTIVVSNSHATVDTLVKILDGATLLFVGPAKAVYGGFAIALPVPLVGSANTAINAQCVTTGAAVRVSLVGYTAP